MLSLVRRPIFEVDPKKLYQTLYKILHDMNEWSLAIYQHISEMERRALDSFWLNTSSFFFQIMSKWRWAYTTMSSPQAGVVDFLKRARAIVWLRGRICFWKNVGSWLGQNGCGGLSSRINPDEPCLLNVEADLADVAMASLNQSTSCDDFWVLVCAAIVIIPI
ncbi:hypothetical protein EV1_043232 [Malus domestica]